ncbi:hypothetical protein DL771_007256 [Monosporascus sp. 5C6A]|nr:hypothetical protein DL771_007256 [Monosporascus sp. 5C6A]
MPFLGAIASAQAPIDVNLGNPVRNPDECTITKLQELVASRKENVSIRHEQMEELFEAAAKANLGTLRFVEPSFRRILAHSLLGSGVRYAVYKRVEAKEAIDHTEDEIRVVFEEFDELNHSGAAKAPDSVLRELWIAKNGAQEEARQPDFEFRPRQLLEAGCKSTEHLSSPVQQQQKLLVMDGLPYDPTDPMGFCQRAELAKPHASQQGDNDGQARTRRRKTLGSITYDIGDMVDECFGDIHHRLGSIRFELSKCLQNLAATVSGPQGWHFSSHAQMGPWSPPSCHFGARVGAQRSEAAIEDDHSKLSRGWASGCSVAASDQAPGDHLDLREACRNAR